MGKEDSRNVSDFSFKELAIRLLANIIIFGGAFFTVIWLSLLYLLFSGWHTLSHWPWSYSITYFKCISSVFSGFIIFWIGISVLANIKYGKVLRFIFLILGALSACWIVYATVATIYGIVFDRSVLTKVNILQFALFIVSASTLLIILLALFATRTVSSRKTVNS